ncbi:phenylpropionate dioxygenase-like ring-hydroxylating dioxygenase large terminal subunit [Dongia mobilis]|uniref:Phenylpropionate dioxygenase-like ring-hydroxylating dioxygenase large terminal subunit n=1 Tax=Dongia mobilis TaxID=578943 RepID=A0A4V3DF59_9PROT|nr:aromatic ring-hydroxylating dioxygenase subunit alpha [Dongia mobilis]TDQ84221.1 phenylpropionate dioxygenase-like ring-hydroxylating dioxygenase large terminal subunit [Dongia mobilis]
MTMMQNLAGQQNGPQHGKLAVSLPAWTYGSDELAELEYERVILPSWQFVCHISQVREAGDFATLDMMKDSVVVLRGKDGDLRAFMNVCRHRAAKLLDGSGSCKGRITCPYHGWSYDMTGELKAIPSQHTFPGVEKEKLGLKPVEMEILHGLVFIRIVPGGPSLRESFGEAADLLAPYRLEEMVPAGEPWIDTWNCNWKIAVDNNLENYHVPVGHPGYHRLLDSDLAGVINRHGVAHSVSVLKDKPSSNWAERMYQKMAPEVLEELDPETRRTWLFYSMAPNIGLDIYPDSFDIFQILPRTGTSCTMRYPVFVRPDSRGEISRERRVVQYLNQRINRQVGAEDRELCERVQLGMLSHGYEPGPLSNYEHAVVDFHNRIRAACPVVNQKQAPESGTVRRRNDALLAEDRPAA